MAEKNHLTWGILVGVADAVIWQHFVPSVADVRVGDAFNQDIEKAERAALIAGSVFTLIVAGFARSAEVFAIGGTVLLALDFATKHANAVNPQTKKMEAPGGNPTGQSTVYPMPDYSA